MNFERTSRQKGIVNESVAKIAGGQISIHRHIDHGPDVWLSSVRLDGDYLYMARPLDAKDLEGAEAEAVNTLRSYLTLTAARYTKIAGALK